MSQVKNLRAMFENKGDTSPPDRGRSSGASTPVQGTAASGTESPVRPLSKVRTNFVAIEKDGRIGLRRDPSHESSVSRRRLSMDTDAESVSTVPDKPFASLEDAPRASKPFFQEAIPESPRHPIDPPKTPTEQIGAVTDEPSVNPDKTVDNEEPSPSLLPAEPVTAEPVKAEPVTVEPVTASPKKENKPPSPPAAVNGKSKTETPKESALTEPAPTTTAKASAPKKTTTTRPSTISTKTPNTKPLAKSPSATKPSTSTTHKPESKPAPKTALVAKETKLAPRTTPIAARPAAAAATASKKPQPLKPTPSDTGFVKPKPKSPTKPVHLPASLMAPTASSGAKTGRQVRPSASSQNLSVPARPASRASVTGTGPSTGKSVKRQPSNVGRSRPSLGPPPKKAADSAQPKKEAPVDESFLARMMRPTQASAQKTTEKVPITPPRKTAKRPSSSGADATRRESSVKTPGSARKVIRKLAESKSANSVAASEESPIVEPVAEEEASEPAKPESPEVPMITTEEPQVDEAPEDSLKLEPASVASEEASAEVAEAVQETSEPQDVPDGSSKEEKHEGKQEEARPVTPEPSKEEATSGDILETATAEESVESLKQAPASELEELVVETEKPTENDDIVPLVEESSTQPPVVVEETNETSTTEPESETKAEVVPLLEQESVPAPEKENTEEPSNEIDTKENVEAIDTTEEKDTTGQQIGEKKQESETVAKAE
ncbi:hypothetical protein F53441_14324 [Fusarium austroafricanum]|uniref:Mucin-7 n=1 Tax=Fusarium austroafricanum TaxID=2364996 RepID=A0A8H4JIF3_9HYPO|nr:hypothetical protein F53441_14324 [Fusarium austroafricanum]